jgi:hypothetical protein
VHRDIGIRDIGGPEVEKVGTLQVLEKKREWTKVVRLWRCVAETERR